MEGKAMNLIASACVALALGACAARGTGTGASAPGEQPVRFTWQSRDGGASGTMSALLADGRSFTGPYLEITTTAQGMQFYPLWAGWTPWWSDWDYGGFGGIAHGFTTSYTGKVVANLGGADSRRMRCTFNLNDPRAGIGGGAQGKCQVAGGATVDAAIPRP